MLDDPSKEVELEHLWIKFARETELEKFMVEARWKVH
jgi:hypothetical protein